LIKNGWATLRANFSKNSSGHPEGKQEVEVKFSIGFLSTAEIYSKIDDKLLGPML
jgi:hypothetical protein